MLTASLTTSMTPLLLTASAGPVASNNRVISGHEMIHIPGGLFIMGSNFIRSAFTPRWVNISGFWISKTAITRRKYKSLAHESYVYLSPDPHRSLEGKLSLHIPPDPYWNPILDGHPMTCVSWEDAQAFGVTFARKTQEPIRLLTEAEWEKGACGAAVNLRPVMEEEQISENDFSEWVRHRYGNFFVKEGGRIFTDPTEKEVRKKLRKGQLLGFRDYATVTGKSLPLELWRDNQGPPDPVDLGVENANGLRGMARGVYEWVSDWYAKPPPVPEDSSALVNPKGPTEGKLKIKRGVSFKMSEFDVHEWGRSAARSSIRPDAEITRQQVPAPGETPNIRWIDHDTRLNHHQEIGFRLALSSSQ